jgi:Flp pilus assembly protein TadD
VVLALVTLVVYSPCFGHPFVFWGDADYVVNARHVHAGLTAENVRWAFTSLEAGNWHPLTWLSLQLDTTLYGGLKPGGFHLTNVLLHTANTLLLFAVLRRMTGLVWHSAVVAALFALHPLQVESVAWVQERKGVLSTLFWMLTLAAYLAYVRRPGIGRYLLVMVALGLGLMAKPMLMTLPFVLLLLDYWPLQRWHWAAETAKSPVAPFPSRPVFRRTLLLEKVPLFVLVLAWCVLTFISEHHIDKLPSLQGYPLNVRVWNALLAYVSYLGKMLWPAYLAAFYPHPRAAVSVLHALGAGLLLVVLTGLVLGAGRRWPYLPVGWLWYLGTLVPVIGLVQIGNHGMADRYAYVPLIGLFLLLTWGAADLATALRLPRPVLLAITAAVLSTCVSRTWVQVGYWKSDRDLWEHALAVTTKNGMAHTFLGCYYHQLGRIQRARQEFEKAVSFDPEFPMFRHNLAISLRDLGREEEGVVECRKALAVEPANWEYLLTLASLLRNLGREEAALAELHNAARLNPGNPVPHNSLANLLVDLDRHDEALREYHKALALDPRYPSPHVGLGNLLASLGRRDEARTEYRLALALYPQAPIPHYNLAKAYQEEGRLEEALAEYHHALDLGYLPAGPRLQACERHQALRPQLPGLLGRRDRPVTNAERLAIADLCRQPFEGRYALAAGLYAEAFKTDPALADDFRPACATKPPPPPSEPVVVRDRIRRNSTAGTRPGSGSKP